MNKQETLTLMLPFVDFKGTEKTHLNEILIMSWEPIS